MSHHAGTQFTGNVAAAFPLALLESVRSHDRPVEILEDEDLTVSLPRRLGLTGVVETQILRYEAASRSGRQVPLGEAMGLFRLVLRRPDAAAILQETGQRVARWRSGRSGLWRAFLHRGPARLALRSGRRAIVATLRALLAGDQVTGTRPFTITVRGCTTARLEDSGPACSLFTGMMEEQLFLYTGKSHTVVHSGCISQGDPACEWTLAE
jgi:hypothetical protein